MENSIITPMSLFWQAGPVVKFVMLILIASSLWCWVIIVECLLAMLRLKAAVSKAKAGNNIVFIQAIIAAGRREAAVMYPGDDAGARRERIVGAMRRRIQETIEAAQGGMSNLAVISSVAPFVGLFGTVWGIMNAFIGIADAKDTSLAVVAPGIAEALAATAVGLATAIPAAFAYNRFAASFLKIGRLLSRFGEDSLPTILSHASPGDAVESRQW